MEKKQVLKYLPRVALITLFVSLSIYFYGFSSPEELTSFIGVQNAYFLIFVLAFIGGMTTFSGIPYHLVLITLATGGLNPFLLGFFTSIGVMCGDSASYYLGYQGQAIIPAALYNIFQKARALALKYPKILPLFFFLYGALSPFSNDFIVISMGMARYPYWRVMLPLGLGNLVFNVLLAYFAVEAYSLLEGIFF